MSEHSFHIGLWLVSNNVWNAMWQSMRESNNFLSNRELFMVQYLINLVTKTMKTIAYYICSMQDIIVKVVRSNDM